MTGNDHLDADAIIIGGGPAGATLGTLLARDGHRVLILEKDIHPRDHVGESLTPSTNLVFEKIGFLDKMNDAGFIHKPGTGWTAPRTRPWNFVEIWLFEFPLPGTPQPYTYNVERDVMDTMLLRHAHDSGAKVLQGVRVQQVLFEDGRAVGVRAKVADGWERDLRAKVVVDASGRRCLLASQLKMKKKDANFNQFCIYSWFEGVKQPPERLDGFTLFYFIGLNQAWAWQIPLRGGKTSMGAVIDKEDFQKTGKSHEEFFYSLVKRNRTFTYAMEEAERVRPWWIEGDYSYKIDRFAGPGWLLIGDALRFVDPIFSSGVDVALFSSMYAYETITEAWRTGNEERPFGAYQDRVETGVDIWYELISTFYRLQNLVTRYATSPRWREKIVRTLQGNPYQPETQARARELLGAMQESYEQVMRDPANLLRPWAMDPERDGTLTCPKCLGVADFRSDEHAFVCRRCDAQTAAPPGFAPAATKVAP
ncbi:MAG TPA: NAD(P)/FAD-dependent oxidoreductase [Actinomycetota bacterium]|nr:NAD(P)/FAD-dependent oxidoreductase [Actinomycetota bacterium]